MSKIVEVPNVSVKTPNVLRKNASRVTMSSMLPPIGREGFVSDTGHRTPAKKKTKRNTERARTLVDNEQDVIIDYAEAPDRQ